MKNQREILSSMDREDEVNKEFIRHSMMLVWRIFKE